MEDLSRMYDAVIIGGGPAGLTAAMYLARARYRVIVLEKETFGGQITITSEVVNYPGVFSTDGKALTETMRRQAENFGAEFMIAEANSLDLSGDIKTVKTGKGIFRCFGVLLATGAHPKIIGFEGEEKFRGRGVAYCATCDGEFFTGKQVFVIGGGYAAAEESVFLTKYASHVTVLIRGEDFSCAEATADEARNHKDITVLTNTEVVKVTGDDMVTGIVYHNNKTGQTTEIKAENGENFGVFVFAGYYPSTDLVRGLAELDSHNYVITDTSQKTNIEGLYAAGDVCVKPLRQVVTAVGEAALAATELERYAQSMQRKTGIIPEKPVKHEKSASDNADIQTESSVYSADMVGQMQTVFSKMSGKLVLKLYTDDSALSSELKKYMYGIAELTDKISVTESDEPEPDMPAVRICDESGRYLGLAFHGVPGGHEFTSFLIGLYNAAGPGQSLDDSVKKKINSINEPTDIRIMVSLSCTMCPELVMSAQRIASLNPQVRAEIYDINHYPAWKDKYNVMSVPCMVINDGKPLFGKKNIEQLLEILI